MSDRFTFERTDATDQDGNTVPALKITDTDDAYCSRIYIQDPDAPTGGARDRWLNLVIPALRGGQFKQVQSRLKGWTPDGETLGYCCLGVATRVMIDALPDDVFRFLGTSKEQEGYYLDTGETLSLAMTGILGTHDDGVGIVQYANHGEMDNIALAEMNDSYEYDFPTIANVIEFGLTGTVARLKGAQG